MDIILTKSASFDAVISQESSEGKSNRHQEHLEGNCSQHVLACITRAFAHVCQCKRTRSSSSQAIQVSVEPSYGICANPPEELLGPMLAACIACMIWCCMLKVLSRCADEPSGS